MKTQEFKFNDSELRALDLLFDALLSTYQLDMKSYLGDSLSIMVLLEFYKKHLSTFKFPERENIIKFKPSVSLAFLMNFKDLQGGSYESAVANSLCRDIILITKGGKKIYEEQED